MFMTLLNFKITAMKAVFVDQPGGVENLKYADLPTPKPGPGQVLVKIAASGVNFIDIYFRTGLYKADPPVQLGMEGSGTVEELGPDVTDLKRGDRVAYAMARGSHAEYAVVPAWQLVPVPRHLDLRCAAASMLQGMTAHYLSHSTYPLKSGDVCLISAAAGGVGLLLVQMARKLGATVIAMVGSDAKAEVVKEAGADHIIVYTKQEFVPEVKKITEGRGVNVVYDSVGKSTFLPSLDCLRPRGMMVTYGNASGPVPEIAPLLLNQKGSLFLTRPTLAHYASTREELLWRAGDVMKWVMDGSLGLRIQHFYKLSEVAQAQRDLESRSTMGKLVLEP
jgi:NADPH2:quinone reductase